YFGGAPGGVKPDPNNINSYNSAVIGTTGANSFTSGTFVNTLAVNNANPASFANSLYTTFRTNAAAASIPANFFLTNPDLQGGATFVGNGGHSYYDSGVIELRRRMSKGLLLQGSYTFARGSTLTTPSLRTGYFKS